MPYSTRLPRIDKRLVLGLLVGVPFALVGLNASLTFVNVWPTAKIRWTTALSIELAVAILILAIVHRWAKGLSRRVLPSVWVVLVAGHYLDVTAPGLYGREFNLYWDSQHIGNVTAMLARAVPGWQIAAAALALVAIVMAMFIASRLAWRTLAAAIEWPAVRRVLGVTASAVIVIFVVQLLSQ